MSQLQYPDNVIGKNAEEIKTEIHTEQDLVNIHDSTANLGEKLEQAMNNFIVSVTGPEAKACLTTIFTICKNILENPNEQKFKSVPLANKNFNVKVGRFPKAIEIMKVIGFKEDPAKGVISFARNDPVLLWLAKSTVEKQIIGPIIVNKNNVNNSKQSKIGQRLVKTSFFNFVAHYCTNQTCYRSHSSL
jgi:hypothetical protein